MNNLLARMVRGGDIKLAKYGKYIPVESVETVETSSIKKDKKNIPALFERRESSSASKRSTVSTLSTGVQDNDPEETNEGAGDETPYDPLWRWRDDYRPGDDADEDEDEDDYDAIMTPDAQQPDLLVPSGLTPALRPASLAGAAKDSLWPIYGDCTGVFCKGACVCGEHLCKDCGCEAGALTEHNPWYFERHQPRRGTPCAFCGAAATVASRWKTPMCERCWQIASQGKGFDPTRYQPRPFGPIPGDEELAAEASAGD